MKKIEAVIDVVTSKTLNTVLTVAGLLVLGYAMGFLMIKFV